MHACGEDSISVFGIYISQLHALLRNMWRLLQDQAWTKNKMWQVLYILCFIYITEENLIIAFSQELMNSLMVNIYLLNIMEANRCFVKYFSEHLNVHLIQDIFHTHTHTYKYAMLKVNVSYKKNKWYWHSFLNKMNDQMLWPIRKNGKYFKVDEVLFKNYVRMLLKYQW